MIASLQPTRPGKLGYMPGAFLGYTPGASLGYMPGAFLGDVADSTMSAAIDAGFDPSELSYLSTAGATDNDFANLINGTVTIDQLVAQYSGGAVAPQPITAAAMNFQPTSWEGFGVQSALQSLGADIAALEAKVASSSAVSNAIGSQVAAAAAQYNSWLNTYQNWVNQGTNIEIYTDQSGNTQIVNSSQAGINPLVIVAAATVTALAAAIVYYHSQTVAPLVAQANALAGNALTSTTAINSANSLLQQGNSYIAQGNALTPTNPTQGAALIAQGQQMVTQANSILGTANTASSAVATTTPTSLSTWISQNTTLIVVAGIAIFLGPSIIKKI